MAFSLVLAGGGLYLQLEENQYKTQLQELSRVRDQKVKHEANNSVSPAMKSLIDHLGGKSGHNIFFPADPKRADISGNGAVLSTLPLQ